MPKWLRRMFSCKVCEAKDAELKRVYLLLADASQDVRDLTKQLLLKEAQAKPQAPAVVRHLRPVPQGDRDVPPWVSSLYTGGHIETSIEEFQRKQLNPSDATVSGLAG